MQFTQSIRIATSIKDEEAGELLFKSGAVELAKILSNKIVVDIKNRRSPGTKVTFDKTIADPEIEFECTCKGFEPYAACPHVWAAARALDASKLCPSRAALAPGKDGQVKKAKALPDWRNQLRRRYHYHRPRSRKTGSDSAASWHSLSYLLDVGAQGDWPTVVPYSCLDAGEDRKFYFPVDLADSDFANSPEEVDRLAWGLLLANRVEPLDDVKRKRKKKKRVTQDSEPTPIHLRIGLDSPLLPILCETGRFRWLDLTHEKPHESWSISWDKGKPWKFRLRIEPPKGKRPWRLKGELYRANQVIPLAEAVRCYPSGLVLLGSTLARLEATHDFCWIDSLAKNSGEVEVPASDRRALLDELWRTGHPPELTGDKSLELPSAVGVPRGSLAIERHDAPDPGRRRPRDCEAEVSFLYDQKRLFPGEGCQCWSSEDGTQIICRDREAEAALIAQLESYFSFFDAGPVLHESPSGVTLIQSRERDRCIQELVRAGWEVFDDIDQVRPLREAVIEASLTAKSIRVKASFDFAGVPATLSEVLSADVGTAIPLSDGSQGLVSADLHARLSLLASIATGDARDSLSYAADQILLVDALLPIPGENIQVRRDSKFSKLVKEQASPATAKPRAAPPQYQGAIPDQLHSLLGGLIRLEELQRSGGVVLTSRMALVLALLAGRQRREPQAKSPRPSLLLVEKGNADRWVIGVEKRIRSLKVANYTGTGRQEEVGRLADYQLIVTTYDTLSRDIKAFRKLSWDYVVFDSAEKLKDPKSDRSKTCKQLKARQQLILLQSSLTETVSELWPVLELIVPRWLGKAGSLRRLLRENRQGKQQLIDALLKGLEPLVLTKRGQ